MKISSSGCTHVGRRTNNEDAFCTEPETGLFAVADGMGGYEGGEIASRLAIDAMTGFIRRNARDDNVTWPFAADARLSPTENMLSIAVRIAHSEVAARKTGRLASMGSTVAALVVREGRAIVAHVGDSRVYRWRAGVLVQLTRDHSLIAEMIAAGLYDEASAAESPYSNVITRALGMKGSAPPELQSDATMAGDVYLLCTDGLSGPIEPDGIAHVLATEPPARACGALVFEAYTRGGRDNITAVVVRVESNQH